MIGHGAILQEDYPEQFVIPQRYFAPEIKSNELLSFTDLEIFVVDAENGRPISNAMISIDMMGKTAVCDKDGRVFIKQLLSGSFIVDVIFPGFSAASKKIDLSGRKTNQMHVQMVRNC